MNKYPFILAAVLLISSCSSTVPNAQEIVNAAIEKSGKQVLENASASFTFRQIPYTYEKRNGKYTYTRTQQDTLNNEVKDVLTNDGLTRFINKVPSEITQKKREAYTASVNSVIYFAFLPYSLNDEAVNKEFVGTVTINDKSYYKIRVTFDAQGGGEDYEDVFFYWFDTEDYSMDFLAYSYNEDDGKGIRFREAFNAREVNGVVIQDYKNYKPRVKDSIPLSEMDQAFQEDGLELLSLIELENVQISY